MESERTPPFVIVHATQVARCSSCGADVVVPARDDDKRPEVTCIPCALGRGDS